MAKEYYETSFLSKITEFVGDKASDIISGLTGAIKDTIEQQLERREEREAQENTTYDRIELRDGILPVGIRKGLEYVIDIKTNKRLSEGCSTISIIQQLNLPPIRHRGRVGNRYMVVGTTVSGEQKILGSIDEEGKFQRTEK